jgi:hypothetical protein
MNYYGEVILEIVPAKEIYQFLREALKRVPEINHLEVLATIEKGISDILTKLKEKLKDLKVKNSFFTKSSSYIN